MGGRYVHGVLVSLTSHRSIIEKNRFLAIKINKLSPELLVTFLSQELINIKKRHFIRFSFFFSIKTAAEASKIPAELKIISSILACLPGEKFCRSSPVRARPATQETALRGCFRKTENPIQVRIKQQKMWPISEISGECLLIQAGSIGNNWAQNRYSSPNNSQLRRVSTKIPIAKIPKKKRFTMATDPGRFYRNSSYCNIQYFSTEKSET